YFIDCCSNPMLIQPKQVTVHGTIEPNVRMLNKAPQVECQNCHKTVTVCPVCNQGFDRIISLANWQNHYSQFRQYDNDTNLRRASKLLGKNFPSHPIESGHRFYTLWQGPGKRDSDSYIWLQQRPAKTYT